MDSTKCITYRNYSNKNLNFYLFLVSLSKSCLKHPTVFCYLIFEYSFSPSLVAYESTVIRSINLPKETNINLEKPTDRREPENKSTMPTSLLTVDRDKPNVEEQKLSVGLEEDPHSPKNSPADITPSNDQSKVTDPMGAGNISSFMCIYGYIIHLSLRIIRNYLRIVF